MIFSRTRGEKNKMLMSCLFSESMSQGSRSYKRSKIQQHAREHGHCSSPSYYKRSFRLIWSHARLTHFHTHINPYIRSRISTTDTYQAGGRVRSGLSPILRKILEKKVESRFQDFSLTESNCASYIVQSDFSYVLNLEKIFLFVHKDIKIFFFFFNFFTSKIGKIKLK